LSKGQTQRTSLQRSTDIFKNFRKRVWETLFHVTQDDFNMPTLQITVPAALNNTILKILKDLTKLRQKTEVFEKELSRI
jgi:hypothetical protein